MTTVRTCLKCERPTNGKHTLCWRHRGSKQVTPCIDCGTPKDKKSLRCKSCHMIYCANISLRRAGKRVKATARATVVEKPQACVEGKPHWWRQDAEDGTWECRWCRQVTRFEIPGVPFGYNGADLAEDGFIRDINKILQEAI